MSLTRCEMIMDVVDRANTLRSEAKFGEAASLLTETLTDLPTSRLGVSKALFEELCFPTASVLAARAYCRVKLGALQGAFEDASRANSFCPEDTSFQLLLAHIHYVMGDTDKARVICSALENDTEPDVAARATRLRKRCAVDDQFSLVARNGVILDTAGYDDDDQFAEVWSPENVGECRKCGAPTATKDESGPTDVPFSSVASTFVKLLHQPALANLLSGPGGPRIQLHLPAIYTLVVQLLHLKEINADIAVELLSNQIGCAFGRHFDCQLQLGASMLFGHADTSRMFRCGPEASSALCARIIARTHRLQSSKTAQKTFLKFLTTYTSAEAFLTDRFVALNRPSGAMERSASIMDEVYECSGSKATPSVAVACAVFPFCAALFASHAGEIVQSFFSNQSRHGSSSVAQNAEDSSSILQQEEVPCTAAAKEDGVTPTAHRHVAAPFMLPIQPSTSIEQFAIVLAPIVRQYYLKRSSTDAREFARDVLHVFAPKEVHGALRSALERMMTALS